MTSRAPGSNSRGRGGKFRKFTRGGGKHFSRDLRPLDAEGNEISMWSEDAQKNAGGSGSGEDEDDSEEDSEEDSEDDSDAAAGGQSAQAAELSREERKREKKARKEAAVARAKAQAVKVGDLPPSGDEDSDEDEDEEDMPANPNHSKAARSQARGTAEADEAAEGLKELSVGGASAAGGTPSRRERESLEAQQAKEKYRKLHEQGKTDEAKADLARLKVIREKREAEAARKQAEKEEKEALDKEKKAELEAREAKKRAAAAGPKTKGKKK